MADFYSSNIKAFVVFDKKFPPEKVTWPVVKNAATRISSRKWLYSEFEICQFLCFMKKSLVNFVYWGVSRFDIAKFNPFTKTGTQFFGNEN